MQQWFGAIFKVKQMLMHFFWPKSSVVSTIPSSLENTRIPHGNKVMEKVKAQRVLFGHLLWLPQPSQLCHPEKEVTHRDSHYMSHLDCFLICGTNQDSRYQVTFPRLCWCSHSSSSLAFIQNCILLWLSKDYKANKVSISTLSQTGIVVLTMEVEFESDLKLFIVSQVLSSIFLAIGTHYKKFC